MYFKSLFGEIFSVPSNHVWLRANACKLPDRLEQTFAFFCCLLVVAYFVYILAKMELTSSEGPLYFYIERENIYTEINLKVEFVSFRVMEEFELVWRREYKAEVWMEENVNRRHWSRLVGPCLGGRFCILAKIELTLSEGPLYFYIEHENIQK